MSARLMTTVAITLWIGILLATRVGPLGLSPFIITATGVMWKGLDWQRRLALVALVGLVSGYGLMAVHTNRIRDSPLATHPANQPVCLTITLIDDPSPTGGMGRITSSPPQPSWVGERLWLPGQVEGVAGARMTRCGHLSRPDGTFSTYLASHRIHWVLTGQDRDLHPPQGWWDQSTAWLRQRLVHATAHQDDALGGLLTGLAIGDDGRMPTSDRDAMRASGLSHLTAVSGSNVALLALLVYGLGWILLLGPRLTRWLTLLAVWWMVWLVRADPSVLRATVMATLVLGSGIVGRPTHIPHALATTVVGSLIVNPFLALQLGFALSVSATMGVLAGAKVMEWLWRNPIGLGIDEDEPPPALPTWLVSAGQYGWSAIGVSIGASLFTAPVLLSYGLAIAPISPWANLVVLPAATLGQWGAMLTTLVSAISIPLASWVADVTAYPLAFIVMVASWGADGYHQEWAMIANLIVGYVVFAVLFHRATNGWIAATIPAQQAEEPSKTPPISAPALYGEGLADTILDPTVLLTRGQFLIHILVCLVVIKELSTRLLPTPAPSQAQFIVLDVGQGDALLVFDPVGGWIMIDTGPDPERIDRHLRTFGIQELQAIIISHGHSDHTGGLDRVLRRVKCHQVMVSPPMVEARAPRTIDSRAVCATHGIPVVAIRQGDQFALGTTILDVLYPPGSSRQLEPNEASVIIKITGPTGLRVLATGDAEDEAQWGISSQDHRCDVLKVPHHGGNTNATGFFERCQAHTAIISCGRDNAYGHPHKDVLQALGGMQVLRTDRDGTCRITI